jgi:hypothetical protein
MDGTNIFNTINSEISSIPTFLRKLLQASAFDTFLALSYLEENDITEIEALCIERFEELNMKDTDFFTYYKSKEDLKFRKGHMKLIMGISNVIKTKGVEFFNKLHNTPAQVGTNARSNPSTSTASTSKRTDIENETKKLNSLLTIALHGDHYSSLMENTDVNFKIKISLDDDNKYAAQIDCPYNGCKSKIRLYSECRPLKKGTCTRRWVVANFKTHFNKHLPKKAKSSAKSAQPSIKVLFQRQQNLHDMEDNESQEAHNEVDSDTNFGPNVEVFVKFFCFCYFLV